MIVSEWIDGPDLGKFTWQGSTMTGRETFKVGLELLDALCYLETEGLVHRDIKPNNMMLTASGDLKVIDFNLMRAKGHQTKFLAGTPAYLPPDIPMDVIDPGLDRYGAGVILYELILGQHPYVTYVRKREQIPLDVEPTDPKSLLPGIDGALSGFLLQAVAVTTPRRFASANEMASAWSSLGMPIEAL